MLGFLIKVFYRHDATILLPYVASPRAANTAPSIAAIQLLAYFSIHLANYRFDVHPVVLSELPTRADTLPPHFAWGRNVELGGRRDLVVV